MPTFAMIKTVREIEMREETINDEQKKKMFTDYDEKETNFLL